MAHLRGLVVLVATACLWQSSSAGITEHPEVRGTLDLLDRWIEAHQIYERVPGISVGAMSFSFVMITSGRSSPASTARSI